MTILSNNLTNICTDLLFDMRYQEDVFCQPRNETFLLLDLLKMVRRLVLFDMILPCNMICDISFSFTMTHPLLKIPNIAEGTTDPRVTKVTFLGYITSSYINLDQISSSESRPSNSSKIQTKLQLQYLV